MFDIGWMEIIVVAVIAVVVVGPKELPRVLANVGRWVAKGRSMAREFQDSVQSVIREAELEELRVDIPDPKKFLGESPLSKGKSILGGSDTVPDDQFIDDQIIAEMEKADAETVDMIRRATGEAQEKQPEPAPKPDPEPESKPETKPETSAESGVKPAADS